MITLTNQQLQEKLTRFLLIILVSAATTLSLFAQSNANRLDASIQRNRFLTQKISELSTALREQQNKVSIQEGTIAYIQNQLKSSRDSLNTQKIKFESDLLKANYKVEALNDSLEVFREYKKSVYRERMKVIKDTNVVRVYDLPFDQVRIRTLRKVLEQGADLLIERNTDEGFVISKQYHDRKSPVLFKKWIDSSVEAEIKMKEHPFYADKTLFYMETKVKERRKNNKPFEEVLDEAIVDDYEKKLLKFFDEFLLGQQGS
jgi:hypothetical protein